MSRLFRYVDVSIGEGGREYVPRVPSYASVSVPVCRQLICEQHIFYFAGFEDSVGFFGERMTVCLVVTGSGTN
jgi:hypothetical protein